MKLFAHIADRAAWASSPIIPLGLGPGDVSGKFDREGGHPVARPGEGGTPGVHSLLGDANQPVNVESRRRCKHDPHYFDTLANRGFVRRQPMDERLASWGDI